MVKIKQYISVLVDINAKKLVKMDTVYIRDKSKVGPGVGRMKILCLIDILYVTSQWFKNWCTKIKDMARWHVHGARPLQFSEVCNKKIRSAIR